MSHSATTKTRRQRTDAPRRTAHKLRSVRLVLKGKSAVEVGAKYGDSPRAVSYWVTRFHEGGAKGLEALPRSGRPPKLSAEQTRKLRAWIAAQTHSKLSGSVVAAFLKGSFGVTVTRQHSLRLVARLRA